MKYVFVFVILLATGNLFSQDYNFAFGVRTGNQAGVSYKKFKNDVDAVEVLASFQDGGLHLTLVRQYYHPLLFHLSNQLFFYYGVGAHLGYGLYGGKMITIDGNVYRQKQFNATVGIDGVLGVEFHFIKYPLVLALDYKPVFEVNIPGGYRNDNTGFGITLLYTF